MSGEPRDFGPYQLVRRLGVGGMAETFEATRVGEGGFEHRVCLKRVLPAFSEDEKFVARFRREAKLAAQLRHTNVVGVIDFGEVEGVHFMALELVDGVDLRSLLRSSPGEKLSAETVTLIGLDLAHGLEHAHSTLVHRDISPSNILVSRSGEAKLADFGIAKPMGDATATVSRSARGKIPYMAPEYIRGEAVDGRADLFSLGVVLFEAAAGVRPFDGAHDVETMQKILGGNGRSLADVAPEVPTPLRQLIERLIEVKAEARTPSATQLIEELACLSPTPQGRRRLAATVEGHCGGPKSRLHVRAQEEERETELSRAPGRSKEGVSSEEPSAASNKRRPRRAAMFAVATLAIALTTVVGTQWAKRRAPAPGSVQPPETVTAAAAAGVSGRAPAEAPMTGSVAAAASGPAPGARSVPGSVPAEAPAPSPTSEPPPPGRLSRGWVHVVVQPWGNVWIDGDWMGRAPVKARLPRGRHVVEVGRAIPSKAQVVQVDPGVPKEIVIDLTE